MHMLSRLVAGLVLAVALVTPLGSAEAGTTQYVALGDSYSSGVGTRSYLADGTRCQRSVYSYPALLAAAEGWSLNLRACSGATVADVTRTQLRALGPSTDRVTISVGGNDAGFAEVLTTCALPWWASRCGKAVDRAQAFLRDTLPGTLRTLYAALRDRAPAATVVVVGYPRIFDGEDCNALTWFSPSEQARLNATADLANRVARESATEAGFGFADPTERFLDHAVCDRREWINGLSHPVTESYHPKRRGHRVGYVRTVAPLLAGSSVRVTAAVVATAEESAGRLAAGQRRYAEADRTIEPRPFRAPHPGPRPQVR